MDRTQGTHGRHCQYGSRGAQPQQQWHGTRMACAVETISDLHLVDSRSILPAGTGKMCSVFAKCVLGTRLPRGWPGSSGQWQACSSRKDIASTWWGLGNICWRNRPEHTFVQCPKVFKNLQENSSKQGTVKFTSQTRATGNKGKITITVLVL
jgi:hypothetical protein